VAKGPAPGPPGEAAVQREMIPGLAVLRDYRRAWLPG